MATPDIFEVVTDTGCTIRLHEFQPGICRLSFDMEQPGDGRHAEVLITKERGAEIAMALGNWVAT